MGDESDNVGGDPGEAASGGRPRAAMWGLGGLLIGAAVSLIFCWFSVVVPQQRTLEARERSLQQWEQLNRVERETIATQKSISVEELRKWVATADEQGARFAELQRILHRQEVELSGPAPTYVVMAGMVVLGVVGLIVFLLRDSNSAAANTLEQVAALAPGDMVRSVLERRLRMANAAKFIDASPPRRRLSEDTDEAAANTDTQRVDRNKAAKSG